MIVIRNKTKNTGSNRISSLIGLCLAGQLNNSQNYKKENFHLIQHKPNPLSPHYGFVFKFENDFDYLKAVQWMDKHWVESFYWSILYLAFIFIGRIIMEKRAKFRLRTPLIIWNIFLAVFSIMGTMRTLPEMLHVLTNRGFYSSVCSNSYHTKVTVSSCWAFLFVLSKLPELVDTVFIVLRRQKLIFLHWYHHATVLIFSWFIYSDTPSTARWYISMNFLVHAIMYSYYAVRAFGFKVPQPLAMSITISQILQMIMGSFVTFYSFWAKTNGYQCQISYDRLYPGMIIYISYLILFAHFFLETYLKPKKKVQ